MKAAFAAAFVRLVTAHVLALLHALTPSMALLAVPKPPFGNGDYLRYREFWGGNPQEVYSHFLDLVLMTGNLAAISAVLLVEGWARRRDDDPLGARGHLWRYATLGLMVSGAMGTFLDANDGEGTVVFTLPELALRSDLAWGPALPRVRSAIHARETGPSSERFDGRAMSSSYCWQ